MRIRIRCPKHAILPSITAQRQRKLTGNLFLINLLCRNSGSDAYLINAYFETLIIRTKSLGRTASLERKRAARWRCGYCYGISLVYLFSTSCVLCFPIFMLWRRLSFPKDSDGLLSEMDWITSISTPHDINHIIDGNSPGGLSLIRRISPRGSSDDWSRSKLATGEAKEAWMKAKISKEENDKIFMSENMIGRQGRKKRTWSWKRDRRFLVGAIIVAETLPRILTLVARHESSVIK